MLFVRRCGCEATSCLLVLRKMQWRGSAWQTSSLRTGGHHGGVGDMWSMGGYYPVEIRCKDKMSGRVVMGKRGGRDKVQRAVVAKGFKL